MKRLNLAIAALAVASTLVACGGGVGGLGTIAPSSPSAQPSLPQSTADATPGGSSSPTQPTSPPTSGPTTGPTTPGSTPGPVATPRPTPTTGPTNPPAGTSIVRAYFYHSDFGFVPVLREVPRTTAVARAAIEGLLAGPKGRETAASAGIDTAIPAGTRLLGLSIAGGTATVDLSGEFEGGGGSASSFIRLGQVVYTLTQFPTVERVAFRINGQDVKVFGSEGIVLDRPQTRADYVDQLPPIWVDRPAWGAAIGNPARVTGTTDVFEAQVNMSITDGNGRKLVDVPVMATCGTGCRGTFDATLPYDVDEAGWGTLRVFSHSAKDGSVEHAVTLPVWLTPQG
jgi:hypothetical protein